MPATSRIMCQSRHASLPHHQVVLLIVPPFFQPVLGPHRRRPALVRVFVPDNSGSSRLSPSHGDVSLA